MKFSEERELLAAAGMVRQPPPARAERPRVRDYGRIVAENRWPILAILALALLAGGYTTRAMRPVYEANLLIQIADSAGPAKSILGENANMFDIKTPATAEMEIMRSRMIVAPAAERHQLAIVAQPRFAFLDAWRPRGPERIAVSQFDIPAKLEDQPFILRIENGGNYSLHHLSLAQPLQGKAGQTLEARLDDGRLALHVAQLQGLPGAEFNVMRRPRGLVVEELQDTLKLVERGRQSGILEATLRDTNAARAAAVLNTIGASYVRQDLERKTAEAEKSLAFVNSQLPGLKAQMDRAEDAYSSLKARKGAVSLMDEAKIALERSSELRGRLADAEQRKTDLLSQFGAMHPSVRIVDEQISGLQRQMRSAQGRVYEMPSTQQDVQRLERDAKLSSDMYQQLRNSAMQLQLIREGRTGNARIIDAALPPDLPVRPKAPIVMGIAAFAGLALSLLFVLLRSGLARGVRNVNEIESGTGLNVYSSAIPWSRSRGERATGGSHSLPATSDVTSVCLRQLRTVLQHQMRDKGNNRMLITGPAAGVGVHFMAAHLAAAFAGAGRRVLLVDADLRRGSLHRYFGVAGKPGLSELVLGSASRKEAIQATGTPRLDLLPSGVASAHLEEFAASRAFQEMLAHASAEYDVVILAAPPVLRSSETLSLVSGAGTVVMVARARKTAVDDIAESARRLTQAGQFPSGVVLNGV